MSPDYFDTMGVALVEGRGFRTTDHAEAAHVAVINASMARFYFPDRSPVGQRVRWSSVQPFLRAVSPPARDRLTKATKPLGARRRV